VAIVYQFDWDRRECLEGGWRGIFSGGRISCILEADFCLDVARVVVAG
jgi:hypothetical protein